MPRSAGGFLLRFASACGLLGGTPPQEREGRLELLRPEDERHPDVDGQRGAAQRDEDQEALREVRARSDEQRPRPGHGVHDRPRREDLEERANEARAVYQPYIPPRRREGEDGQHGVGYG